MFRLQTGEVGVRAIKPVIVDGEIMREDPVIVDGQCVANRGISILKSNSTVVLCEEDMTVVAEYQIQIAA